MKPTKTQKEICNVLIKEISWWRDSNDIDSSTHLSDMEDCMKADLDGLVSDGELQFFLDDLMQLFSDIRDLSV